MRFISILPQIAAGLLALSFASCGIHNIQPETSSYFERKTASFSYTRGKKLDYYRSETGWNVQINIDGKDDAPGLKAIRTLSRDPQIPLVGLVNIRVSDATNRVFFKCSITRDDLLNGREPKVTIRNGIRVTGRYKGTRSDFSPTGMGEEMDAAAETFGNVQIIRPDGSVFTSGSP